MDISILFKIFSIIGIVSVWASKALQDGKVTIQEATELGLQLAAALGIETIVSLPNDQNTVL